MHRFVILALTSLFFTSCQPAAETRTVTILHWNDFHAQNRPFRAVIKGDSVTVGGIAYLAGLIDSLRMEEPGVLTLHAGDEFMGSAICAVTKGKSQIELLNLVKPDAFALGNHEFDYGWDNLKGLIGEANFPVLCCNVVDSTTGDTIARSFLITERNGVIIGIIGLISRALEGSVFKGALSGLNVENPVDVVQQLLPDLIRKTDIQIVLSHQGVEADKRLARECPDLDLIVGGHWHTVLSEPLVENGVPILQAGSKGMYLGFFQAEVDTAADRIVSYEGRLIPILSETIQLREELSGLVDAQEKIIAAELDRVIGVLKTPWLCDRSGESNVGNWTADAFVSFTGCDIGLINSGGMRKDLPAGPVTVRDLWELHPFGNNLMRFDLKGEELFKAVSFFASKSDDLLQVGGMRYRAKRSDGKVIELTVGGNQVQPEKRYSIVTNEYVVGHSEKYLGFSLADREVTDLGWIDREVIERVFSKDGEVSSYKDGRIVIED